MFQVWLDAWSCITEQNSWRNSQIHECRSCLCLQRNLHTEAKAPYHLGKPAEFTEIHDYLLIQLHPISLSFLTVEHSEMKIWDQHMQQSISYVVVSCVKTLFNTKQVLKQKCYLCCFDPRMNVMSSATRFNNTSRHVLQPHEEWWSACVK